MSDVLTAEEVSAILPDSGPWREEYIVALARSHEALRAQAKQELEIADAFRFERDEALALLGAARNERDAEPFMGGASLINERAERAERAAGSATDALRAIAEHIEEEHEHLGPRRDPELRPQGAQTLMWVRDMALAVLGRATPAAEEKTHG